MYSAGHILSDPGFLSTFFQGLSDVGSQLQQVCEAQVPRRSTASSVDDGCLGGLQRLEIWTGKSQAPERFGILLRLWSLLLRRQGGIILRL